ncbi:hypothetical protein HOU95_gp039 [Streptomyces phage Hiyaa]|uniref:Uncharacterized protein n=1 Tax=Streptomyces phage Hiyaa TaxID=2499072 RepID=A0A3S9U8Z2_9CAUD|nr:hypothetical protein HOU95_gp039 [Streptomyces phage Hiyaa]AZS06679.1 hypothetical protein SEA_HIYAA_39 [Streptomyces phage Hiyaa]
MTDLTPDEITLVQFENTKENLISQMVVYGIDRDQARIQVEGLVTWTMRAKEAIDRAVSEGKAGVQMGRRQDQEGT